MVRERVNTEIKRQHSLGRTSLPPLQPPGCLDGLEMFGFSSTAIMQVNLLQTISQFIFMHHGFEGFFFFNCWVECRNIKSVIFHSSIHLCLARPRWCCKSLEGNDVRQEHHGPTCCKWGYFVLKLNSLPLLQLFCLELKEIVRQKLNFDGCFLGILGKQEVVASSGTMSVL